MNSLRVLSLSTLLAISGCKFIDSEKIYACKGEIIESHSGKATNNTDYKFIDSVSFKLSKKDVQIKGPTELRIAQYFDKDDNSHIGYKFSVCNKEDEFIYFNNYNCKDSNKYPSFDVYEGEFNKVTKRLVIQTRNVTPLKDISITQKASYVCEAI